MAASFQQPIRQPIGLLTCCLTPHDVIGQAPQIFHEHDAQRDRNRPELTYRQRLYALIGACETMQHFGVEPAVGVCDERPSQPEHARISFERPFHQLRQLAIEAWWKVDPDFPKLLLDHVKIVE